MDQRCAATLLDELSSLDTISLNGLENKVDECRKNYQISDHQLLNAYLMWVHNKIVGDRVNGSNSLLFEWTKSLLDRDVTEELIRISFKNWQEREAMKTPSTIRRFLLAEHDLNQYLDSQRHSHSEQQQHARQYSVQSELEIVQPHTSDHEDQKVSSHWRRRGKNRQRTGANEIPVSRRKPDERAERGCTLKSDVVKTNDGDSDDVNLSLQQVNRSDFSHKQRRTSIDNQDKIIITGQTILLDSPTKELFRLPDQLILGPKGGGLVQQQPGESYVCKRCNKRGHFIHLCPTNLDPGHDMAPPSDYTCQFCGETGHHFATLCPKNKNDWSLTQLRKRAAGSGPKPKEKRRPPLMRHDIYRPRNTPPPEASTSDRARSTRRDCSSSSLRLLAGSSAKPSIQAPAVQPENVAKSNCRERGDHYRPDRRKDPERSRSRASKVGKHRMRGKIEEAGIEGRLFYKDDDNNGSFSLSIGKSNTTNEDSDGLVKTAEFYNEKLQETNAAASKTAVQPKPIANESPDKHWEKDVSAEADIFLQNLEQHIRDNAIANACSSTLDDVMVEVCGTSSSPVADKLGSIHQTVTSPPFCEHVLQLFSKRPNPVINRYAPRKTAVQAWEEVDRL
ncbi:hypothetical protein BX600DRAFT_14674 [Xylariales sp. PMI_506]|nr:hypothetical protein BX600DRAFT_14674 [Xylariales sp. PMI_506]